MHSRSVPQAMQTTDSAQPYTTRVLLHANAPTCPGTSRHASPPAGGASLKSWYSTCASWLLLLRLKS